MNERANTEASVIIPALNVADSIKSQLDTLLGQEPGVPFEVIVSDNGSTDATRAIVESLMRDHSKLRLVDASALPGISYSRNCGAAAARGCCLLFCDGDDIVGEGWIGAMVRALDTSDVVGGYLDFRKLNDPAVVQWRGEGPRDRLPGTVFLPSGYGANMATTRAAFEAIGGFDLDLTRGGEDLNYFWRAQLAGFSAGFAPEAVVFYRLRDDLRGRARQAFFYGRSVPQLYRLHRVDGMRRRPLRVSLRQAGWVVVHAPDWFRGRGRRGQWVWGASNLLGRVVGAIRFRVASV